MKSLACTPSSEKPISWFAIDLQSLESLLSFEMQGIQAKVPPLSSRMGSEEGDGLTSGPNLTYAAAEYDSSLESRDSEAFLFQCKWPR